MKKLLSVLFLLSFTLAAVYAQNIQIKGTVVSGTDNEPLPGVNVVVKGNTSTGTITDFNGTFTGRTKSWCCPTAWWPNRARPMHFMPGTASTPTWWICRPKARAGPSDPIQKQPLDTTKKDIYSKE